MDDKRVMKLRRRIATAPLTPGVYFMHASDTTIIYIGKSRCLRYRLRSYLRMGLDRKTDRLMAVVADISWQETAGEVDALLLESELVRKFRPRYNVDLKDDKRFPHIVITTTEPFPRLLMVRNHPNRNDYHFGPFPDAAAARRLVELLRRNFKLRTCQPFRVRRHPCINAQINLCRAPCIGKISEIDYQEAISSCRHILQGKGRELTSSLEKCMAASAAALEYEKAANVRDTLRAVQRILRRKGLLQERGRRRSAADVRAALLELKQALGLPKLPIRIEGYDIAQGARGRYAIGAKISMVWGELARREYRLYGIREVKGSDDYAMLSEVVSRRLLHPEDVFPDLLLVDGGKGQLSVVRQTVAAASLTIPVIALAKKEERLFTGAAGREVELPEAARNLLIRLRDETHRFGNTAFRQRRGKNQQTATLEQVPGIGKTRALQLLRHYAFAELLRAETQEVAKLTGVPKKLIVRVKEFFS